MPPQYLRTTLSVPESHGDIARVTIDQRAEVLHHSRGLPATGALRHQALHDPLMQVADQLRIGLGQLPEGAVEEVDADPAGVGATAAELRLHRIEPETVELGHQRRQTAPPTLAPAVGVGAPPAAEVGGVEPVAAQLLGQGAQKAGEA